MSGTCSAQAAAPSTAKASPAAPTATSTSCRRCRPTRGTTRTSTLVKVYETGDGSIIPLIESLLEDANIEFEVTNKRRT